MRHTLVQTLLIASGLVVFNAAFAQEVKPLVISDPVAKIQGKPVTKAEFEKFALPHVNGNLGLIQTTDQVNALVDAYALEKVLVEKAKAGKLDATEEYKSSMEQISRALLADAWIKKAASEVKVTDAEVKAEYDKQYAAIDKKEYKAAHILVETEDEAKKVLAELTDTKKPAKFEELAEKYSKDPGSAQKGGDLGWFRPQMMVKEFSDALATLKKGEVTKAPVKSQFGYHIIKLEDERATPIDSLDKSQERIKQSIIEVKTREKLEQVQKDLKIEYEMK